MSQEVYITANLPLAEEQPFDWCDVMTEPELIERWNRDIADLAARVKLRRNPPLIAKRSRFRPPVAPGRLFQDASSMERRRARHCLRGAARVR
jgi:hypothetical protein